MITFIDNQTIRFRTAIDESCDCLGRPFCQKINKNDSTKFQLKSTDILTNGGFDVDLSGWNLYQAISGIVDITNESATDECDGEVTITASGGTGGYTYSIDGTTFQAGATFSNLCDGEYTVTIKDSSGNEGSVTFTVFTNVTCIDYKGFTLQQFIDSGITLGQIYNCTLDDLKP